MLTTSFPRWEGDFAGNFVQEMAYELVARGHEVEVVAAGKPCTRDEFHPFEVRRIPLAPSLFYQGGAPDSLLSSALSRRARGAKVATFSAAMVKEVLFRKKSWDGVVAHWLAPCALVARVAAPRLPLWCIAHGGDVDLLERWKMLPGILRLLDGPRTQLACVSEDLLERMKASVEDREYNYLRNARVAPMGLREQIFAKCVPRDLKPPLILFLGRLAAVKRVELLLDACAELDVPYTLIIAGDGPLRGVLESLSASRHLNCEFAGEVLEEERDRLLDRATVLVLPSGKTVSDSKISEIGSMGRREGMPRSALEALAKGVQLVHLGSGGLAEIPPEICWQTSEGRPLQETLRAILKGQRRACGLAFAQERSWEKVLPALLPGL